MNKANLEIKETDPKIEEKWKFELEREFSSEYFQKIKDFLHKEAENGIEIYPGRNNIFSAFNFTPFEKVKVVILGQDPYHGAGQAQGLSFSVSEGMRLPPSLQNIFKELKSDLGIEIKESGNLQAWAEQGVLLLNACLTVRAGEAGSHQGKGWETFTDRVIQILSAKRSGIIFMLWGNFAKAKESLIDSKKHFVLKATHPSPFSAYQGFFGCKHFSKANNILRNQGQQEINWQLAK